MCRWLSIILHCTINTFSNLFIETIEPDLVLPTGLTTFSGIDLPSGDQVYITLAPAASVTTVKLTITGVDINTVPEITVDVITNPDTADEQQTQNVRNYSWFISCALILFVILTTSLLQQCTDPNSHE